MIREHLLALLVSELSALVYRPDLDESARRCDFIRVFLRSPDAGGFA